MINIAMIKRLFALILCLPFAGFAQNRLGIEYLRHILNMPEVSFHFRLCRTDVPLTVIDTSSYFSGKFMMCSREVKTSNMLPFIIDVNNCCKDMPQNVLVVEKQIKNGILRVWIYNPSDNTVARVKITNYDADPVYKVADLGVF